jgi:hypothetical protein
VQSVRTAKGATKRDVEHDAASGKHANLNGTAMRPPVIDGLGSKQLLGIPWRVAFGLQDDGWTLRADIIWAKPNPMPESVTDRPTRSHEYIFLLAKGPKYWYDAAAVAEEAIGGSSGQAATFKRSNGKRTELEMPGQSNSNHRDDRELVEYNGASRNRRTVWTITPANYADAHFATFPEAIPEICIKAGCPEWCCDQCGAPWVAQVERESNWADRVARGAKGGTLTNVHNTTNGRGMSHDLGTGAVTHHGYAPSCTCNAGKRAGVVMDIFMGAGTTALVAKKLNRRYLGCDLNADYVEMARRRVDGISYTLFSLMAAQTGD